MLSKHQSFLSPVAICTERFHHFQSAPTQGFKSGINDSTILGRSFLSGWPRDQFWRMKNSRPSNRSISSEQISRSESGGGVEWNYRISSKCQDVWPNHCNLVQCKPIILFQDLEYPGKLFRIGILGGEVISGRKYVTEWE